MKWIKVGDVTHGEVEFVPVDKVTSVLISTAQLSAGANNCVTGSGEVITSLAVRFDERHAYTRVDHSLIPAAIEALGIGEALGRVRSLPPAAREKLQRWHDVLQDHILVGAYPSEDFKTIIEDTFKQVREILGMGVM